MALKSDALHKGLSNIVAVDTHIAKGSKLAKGQDSVAGEIAQFSSLMNVMNDDHVLMGEMERAYQVERSSVVPVLPTSEPLEATENSDVPIEAPEQEMIAIEGELVAVLPEMPAVELPMVEFQNLSLVDDAVDLVQQELATPVLDLLEQDLVESLEQPLQVAPIVQSQVTTPVEVQKSQIVQSAPVKSVVVPEISLLPEAVIKEVVDVFSDLSQATVDIEASTTPPLGERFELPSFLREGVRLLDDEGLSEVIEQELSEVSSKVSVESSSVIDSGVALESEGLPLVQDPNLLLATNGVAQSIGAAAVSASSAPMLTSVQADGVSIQQSRDLADLKRPKLPKMQLTRQHFEQTLEEGQEAGTEKMNFANKLLQRLELVVMDPLGRIDIEVAQEIMGVQVKTVVPSEMVQALQGVEQDLQLALNNQGLELSSFELQEREEGSENHGSSKESAHVDNHVPEENDQNDTVGGMLVSRRV